MSFERLAEEILLQILAEVALLDNLTSTYRHLARVNRTLNRLVTPLLYTQYIEANRSTTPKLLRTLLSNPDLANEMLYYDGQGIPNAPPRNYNRIMSSLGLAPKYIVSGFLSREQLLEGVVVKNKEKYFLDMSCFAEDDFARCRDVMKRIACPNLEEWMADIRVGQWHAVTSILLLLLPNVEDFSVTDYRDDVETGYFDTALGIAARLQKYPFLTQFTLKHLTKVELEACEQYEDEHEHEEDEYGIPIPVRWETGYLYLADIVPFLKLPSVKSVSVRRLSASEGYNHYPIDDYQDPYPRKSDLKFTTTQELELHDSVFDMSQLDFFLKKFTQLRRFTYEHVATRVDFLPQEIGKALAHLKPCLEELKISSCTEENGYNNSPAEIGSLAKFEKLRIIDLEGPDLLGYPSPYDGELPDIKLWEILPPSLERLKVGGIDGRNQEEHLKGLLSKKRERFPNLKRVQVNWGGPEQLKRDFKAEGVKLTL